MNPKDYLLIVVLYGSLVCGLFFPESSKQISPYIKYLMMTMLFLSFIKISPGDVWQALRTNWAGLILGTVVRLVVAPALAYYATVLIYPPLAFSALLLAGVSTGVSSPFFTSLCKGDISFCLVMAVATSLLVPASLPFMVSLLAGSTLDYDLTAMALFLAMIIFIPLAAAFGSRILIPGILGQVNRWGYPISLCVIAAINFGALGRYVPYLKANPDQILYCALFSIVLAVMFALMGWIPYRKKAWPGKVASSGSQVWVNNVLIIALAIQMDQALAATLSSFYFIPLYGFVVYFSTLADKQTRLAAGPVG